MHLQCTMSSIFDWEVRRLGMRDMLRHGTITVSGFGYFHKNCRFLWGKKMFQRQIQEVQYTIPIHHITNISDFVWFQRSCGSIKSVSSFSSIDFIAYHTFHTIHKHSISDHRMILFKNIVLILSTKLFKMLLQQHLFGLTPTLFLSFNTDIIIFCVLVEISTYTCRHYNFQNYLNCLKKNIVFFANKSR